MRLRRNTIAAAVIALVAPLATISWGGSAQARTEQQSSRTVELPGGRAVMAQIAHNPERNEFLAVWRSRFGTEDISAVRLDRDGQPIGAPFVAVPEDSEPHNNRPAVAYNPNTDQYVIAYQRADLEGYPTGGQTSLIFARLLSDTGTPVGPEVQISPDYGTYWFCQANNPNVAYDATTGGYMFAYTKHNFFGEGECSGFTEAHSYGAVVHAVSGTLVPGTAVMAPHPNRRPGPDTPAIEPHPSNGTFMVFESTGLNEGHAYLYDSNVTLLRDVHIQQPDSAGTFSLQSVAADPLTGNWLLAWRQHRAVETVTTVLDADGDVVHPIQVGATGAHTIDIAAVGDGTWVGLDTAERLVHFGPDGTAIAIEELTEFRTGGGLSQTPGGSLAIDLSGDVPRVVALGKDPASLLGVELQVATADVYPPGNLPVVPARLLETRSGPDLTTVDGEQQGIGKPGAGVVTTVQVAGRGGIPADATAAVLNVTQVEAVGPGYLTVYPCDATKPNASSLNYAGGGANSSAVFVKLSAQGTACVYTLAAAHLVVDVNSFVPARGSVEPVVPARLLETRSGYETVDTQFNGIGRVAGGAETPVTVVGRGEVADDASAVLVNVTAVSPAGPTFVTVYPCGETRPQASNLNATTGQVVNNLALAKVGTNGQICLYSLADTDLIVDVAGFVPAGGGLLPLVPARLLETRSGPNDATIDGAHEGDGQIVGGQFERVVIAGRGGVPDDATGAMLNTTAIAPADYGFMTLYPCDAERPNASNVNHGPGDVVANAVFVKLDPSGAVCVYSHSTSHVAIDVVGYTRDG